MDQSFTTLEQQSWLHKFIGYEFTIEYRPGKNNLATDALPRVFTLSWSEPKHQLLTDLKQELEKQVKLQLIVSQCKNNKNTNLCYSLNEGLLYWKNRLVVPANDVIKQQILTDTMVLH